MGIHTDEDYLLLSGIQHYEFCKRQWALIHIEQQWSENDRTTAGELMHKKAHEETSVEKRGDILIMRGLRVFSHNLRISGQCDVVEFRKTSVGVSLSGYDGFWGVIPVEYKHGTEKEGREDEVQLCAQAMCLEEMLLTEITKGYLYYGKNKRRTEVAFDQELRSRVEIICKEMQALYHRGHTPKVKTSKKCRACSLKDLCIPKLNKSLDVNSYIEERLKTKGGE